MRDWIWETKKNPRDRLGLNRFAFLFGIPSIIYNCFYATQCSLLISGIVFIFLIVLLTVLDFKFRGY